MVSSTVKNAGFDWQAQRLSGSEDQRIRLIEVSCAQEAIRKNQMPQ
jgi:hypothetical protein